MLMGALSLLLNRLTKQNCESLELTINIQSHVIKGQTKSEIHLRSTRLKSPYTSFEQPAGPTALGKQPNKCSMLPVESEHLTVKDCIGEMRVTT